MKGGVGYLWGVSTNELHLYKLILFGDETFNYLG